MFRRLIFCRLGGQEPYLETAMFRVLTFSQLFLELCWAILFCMIGFDCLSTSNLFCFQSFLFQLFLEGYVEEGAPLWFEIWIYYSDVMVFLGNRPLLLCSSALSGLVWPCLSLAGLLLFRVFYSKQ